MDATVAIIGTGTMGEALLSGVVNAGVVTPERLVCTARRSERCDQIASRYQVSATTDNRQAISGADVVVLAVKPQVVGGLLDRDGDAFSAGQTLVSVVAGVPTSRLETAIPARVGVVRVMSNVGIRVDEAMSVVAPGAHADDNDVDIAEEIFSPVGAVVRLDEEHLDAVTGLSGSGPAYVALLAEAMVDAGVLLGLPREIATRLVVQTMVGTAGLLSTGGRRPGEVREMVSSPAGTTVAGLRELESAAFRGAVLDAVTAAARRSRELAGS